MTFTSASFLLFAALTVLLYFTVPRRGQWWVLLVASYVFYLFAGVEYLAFLLYATVVSYVVARLMQARADAEDAFVEANRDRLEKSERKAFRAKEKKKRFFILVGGLVAGFGMLAVLKYTGFAAGIVCAAWTGMGNEPFEIPDLLLPLGISFYTFQAMGYLIDVYRKNARAERNFFRFALFISYFPQLIQGPISRFEALSEQLFATHAWDATRVRSGLARVLWGFFKKLVVADTAMIAVKTLVTGSDTYTGAYVFLLILLYSAQIYGDFTGGIDVTIGLSEILGIRVAENFNRPFSSKSTKEYWRRWHITMGTWFTDYVFYPLSVCSPMQRFSKFSRAKLGNAIGKRLPVYVATVATWFLTGLWHGAGWNFIVWGLLNCLVILVSQELTPLYDRFHAKFPRLVASGAYGVFQMARTFLLMGLIRSLDCYRDVGKTFSLWFSMLTDWNLPQLLTGGWRTLGLTGAEWCMLGLAILLVFAVSLAGKKRPVREWLSTRPVTFTLCACGLILLILLFGAYGIGYDASQFIYNQF
ncbi:MAG: MBOAT family protein [Clostridia bacterium]|nr:MBOAT family protein [Clostridia bacterium]